jgi:hypothetical protein
MKSNQNLDVFVRSFFPTRLVLIGFFAGMALGSFGRNAWAQPWASGHFVENVRTGEAAPARPLVVPRGQVQWYSGLVTDFSKDNVLKAWGAPAGASFGVRPGLEVGVDGWILLKPWAKENLITEARLYGRHILIDDQLAAEVGIYVPTRFLGMTGLEVLAPARYKLDRFDIFGQGKMALRASELLNSFEIGVSATALAEIKDQWLAIGELAATINTVSSGNVRVNDLILPIGIGAGYQISKDTFIKAVFNFTDITRDASGASWGIDRRTFMITVVSTTPIGEVCPPPRASAEKVVETPIEPKAETRTAPPPEVKPAATPTAKPGAKPATTTAPRR